MVEEMKEEVVMEEVEDWFPCTGAVLSLAQTHRGRPQTASTRLYAGGQRNVTVVSTWAPRFYPWS